MPSVKVGAGPVDISGMQRCTSCGAGIAPGAEWCGQCFAPVPAPAGVSGGFGAAPVTSAGPGTASAGGMAVGPIGSPGPAATSRFAPAADVPGASWRPAPAPDPLRAPPRYSRWRKTATTFGPMGRVLCTLGLVIPFLFLIVMGVVGFDPFVLGGAGIWGVIIMPWGLRDTWRAGQLPAG